MDVLFEYSSDQYEDSYGEVAYTVNWVAELRRFEIKAEDRFLSDILSDFDLPEIESGRYQLISEEALRYLAGNDDFITSESAYRITFSHSDNSGELLLEYINKHSD